MAEIVLYREDQGKGKWRWRLLDDNGDIVAVSGENFADKHNVMGSKNNLCQEVLKDTPIVEDDSDAESGKVTRFAYFKGGDGEYYWRLQNKGNNKIIASGGEGFPDEKEVIAECEKVRALIFAVPAWKFENPEDDEAAAAKDEDSTEGKGFPGS